MNSPPLLRHVQALDELLTEQVFSTRICGTCMAPVVPDGAMVEVQPNARLRTADIFVFRDSAGQLVCHRFLGWFPARGGWRALSWADHAVAADSLVGRSAILGRVTKVNTQAVQHSARLRALLRYARYFFGRLAGLLKR